MRNFTQSEQIRRVQVLSEIKCDLCTKEIVIGSNVLYYEVKSSHNHWGNDSIESVRDFDLCSKTCLSNHINTFINESTTDGYEYEITTERA